MLPLLIRAGQIALSSNINDDRRNFLLGCVGIRRDGAIVSAKNGAVITSSYSEYRVISDAHAEIRCLKKMGRGGVLYTARILKKDGSFAMAKACGICSQRIRAAEIDKVFYTIDAYHYGVWNVKKNYDKIYYAGPS